MPNFAHGLWRHCLFAATVGSMRGHRVVAGPDYMGDYNDRFYSAEIGGTVGQGSRSQIFEAGGFTPNGVNWQTWSMGRGFDNGDGAVSLNPQGWNDALPPTIPGVGTGNRYDLPQPVGVPQTGATWAVIIRPDAFSTNGQIPFFKRRAQPYGTAQPGWCFTGAAGNLWRFQISDGVTQFTRTSTTTQDANFNRSDLLVIRYAAVPGSATNSRMEFWVNGVAEAGVAGSPSFATIILPNPAGEDIKILGYGPLNETYPAFIPFAAFWGRPLSNGELNQLYTDPFIMWRWQNQRQTIIGAPQRLGGPLANRGALPGSPLAPPVIGAAGQASCCCCAAASAVLF